MAKDSNGSDRRPLPRPIITPPHQCLIPLLHDFITYQVVSIIVDYHICLRSFSFEFALALEWWRRVPVGEGTGICHAGI